MTYGAVVFKGFEEALAAAIASGFRFSSEALKSIALKLGRHLFVNELLETEEIADTEAGAVPEYDPRKEPAIALYPERGPRALGTVSHGGRLEISVEFVLRLAAAPDVAKQLLEELLQYLDPGLAGTKAGKWQIKRARITAAPNVIGREVNDAVLVSGSVRFFAVPLAE